MKINRIKSIISGLFCTIAAFGLIVPVYAESGKFYNSSEYAAPDCGYDKTKSLKYQCEFFCEALGLNVADYYSCEEDPDGGFEETARTKELESMYLEKLGYTDNASVIEDKEHITYKYRQFSFELNKVIETENCYSKEDIDNIGVDGNYVVMPLYSINYNGCRLNDGLTVTIHDDSNLNLAAEAAKQCIGDTGISKFAIDVEKRIDGIRLSTKSYYYSEGEMLFYFEYYDEPVYDEDGVPICSKMCAPDGRELSELEQDDLMYKYYGLTEDDLLRDKKHYLDSIFFQYIKSNMTFEEAISKYDEMLANLDHISLNELERIYDDALNRVIDEKVEAMEDRNHQKSDKDIPDLTGTGYIQDLVGNIPTLKSGTPTKVRTRLINGCPIVDLLDDNYNDLVGCPVFNVEHTKFKYVYLAYFVELDDGHVTIKLAGSDDAKVGGINSQDRSTVWTPEGDMGITAYYEDVFAGEEVEGELDPYGTYSEDELDPYGTYSEDEDMYYSDDDVP